jgi:hypothetical protein
VIGKAVSLSGKIVCNYVAEGWMKKIGCGPIQSLLSKAASAAGKVKSKLRGSGTASQIGAAGGITLAGITGWVGAGAVWVLHKAASVIGSTTEPNVHAPFFESEYKRMIELAALLALPMLLLAIIEGLLRSNWEILQRALLAVPTAFLITAMAVVLVGIGVTLSDLMGQSVAAGAQADAKKFFDHAAIVLGVLLAVGGAAGHLLAGHAPAAAHLIKGAPLFIVAVGSLYAFLAAGLVLLELFMREVGIFATLLFVPIVMAARIWPKLGHWGRELTQGLVALILSKFAIVAILAFAAAAGSSWHPTVLLIAFALLTIAAISPAALFGIVRFAEHSWHQRGSSRAMVVQTVSAAEQMRRTFMTHNPGHRIDPPGRTAAAAEDVQRAVGKDEPASRGQARAAEHVRDQSQDRGGAADGSAGGAKDRGSGRSGGSGRGSSGAGASRPGQSASGGSASSAGQARPGSAPAGGPGGERAGGGRASGPAASREGEGPKPRTPGPRPLRDNGPQSNGQGGRVRHIFGQIERHTVFGDLRAGQRVALALALVGTIAALVSGQSILHLALAGLCATGGAWVAFGRLRGLAPADWVSTLSGHGAQAATRGLGYESPAPGAGVVLPKARDARMVVPEALPPELGDLAILEAPAPAGGVLGVVKDRRADTYTGAVLARAPAFGPIGSDGQELLQSDYADVLGMLAREDGLIRRVGWVDSTLPVYGDEIAGWFETHRDRGLSLSSPAMRSMMELTDSALTVGQEHQILVCLQLSGRRARRHGKQLGKGEEGALTNAGRPRA